MRKFDIPKYIYLRYISLYELDMRYVLGVNPQYQMNTFIGIPRCFCSHVFFVILVGWSGIRILGGSTTPLAGESFGRDQLASAFGSDDVVDGPGSIRELKYTNFC